MGLSMAKEHTFMQTKILTQDGGCLAKNMDKELTPIAKLEQNSLGSGMRINLFRDVGFSLIMGPTIQEPSPIISQMGMEFGISQMEMLHLAIISKLLFPTKTLTTKRST